MWRAVDEKDRPKEEGNFPFGSDGPGPLTVSAGLGRGVRATGKDGGIPSQCYFGEEDLRS